MCPIAERTPTTRCPSLRAATSRAATRFSFSGSPTEVPPNLSTSVPRGGASASASTAGTASYSVVATVGECRGGPGNDTETPQKNTEPTNPKARRFRWGESRADGVSGVKPPCGTGKFALCAKNPLSRIQFSRRPRQRTAERDLVGVLEVAADGEAAREPRHGGAVAQPVGEVRGGRLARHVRVRREHHLADLTLGDALEQLVDAQVLRLDPVERRERAAEHVVEAAVLVGALERDHVDGLLDDADDRAVAAGVEADPAELLLGQVAALAAEANALLHLLDRRRQRERLVLRRREDVEREPLRGARADPRQARQLRDEIVHRRAEHARSLAVQFGRPIRSSSSVNALECGTFGMTTAGGPPPGSLVAAGARMDQV